MTKETFEINTGQPESENKFPAGQDEEAPADFKLETPAGDPVDKVRLEEVRRGLKPDWEEGPRADIPITVKGVSGGVVEEIRKKSWFNKVVASIGMAGILGGAISDKALADEDMRGPGEGRAPVFSSGERPSDAGQIFSAGERQGNWVADSNIAGTHEVRQEINRVPAEPNVNVENSQPNGRDARNGRVVGGGGMAIGGSVGPGKNYRGNFVSPGIGGGPRMPQGPRYYDRVEGNAGGATWVHEVGNNPGNRFQTKQNEKIDNVYERSGGKFIGTHADDQQPVHRNPFNLKNWFKRGR